MNPINYPKCLRARWYLQVDKYHKSVREACSIFGISRKTYYKWYKIDHGQKIFTYRGAKVQPNIKLTQSVRQMIEKEKLLTNYGPYKMKLLLKHRLNLDVSTTIIYRFYLKKHLIRKPQKRLPWYQPLKNVVIPTKPGEVVQLDTKYVWIKGRRKYQRTLTDIYTGLANAIIVATLDAQDTIKAFKQTERLFSFKITGVQTDNGAENRGKFHQYLGLKGIAHYFIPKSSPNWNGAVERLNGVIDQEYYFNPYKSWKSLKAYVSWYNNERFHLGKYLHGQIPMQKYINYLKNTQKVLPLTVN